MTASRSSASRCGARQERAGGQVGGVPLGPVRVTLLPERDLARGGSLVLPSGFGVSLSLGGCVRQSGGGRVVARAERMCERGSSGRAVRGGVSRLLGRACSGVLRASSGLFRTGGEVSLHTSILPFRRHSKEVPEYRQSGGVQGCAGVLENFSGRTPRGEISRDLCTPLHGPARHQPENPLRALLGIGHRVPEGHLHGGTRACVTRTGKCSGPPS